MSDGPNFILKVGHSKDILNRLHQHQRTNSNLRIHGEVEFLFGTEIDKCDRVPVVSLLKVMLTEFGFSHVTVYNKEGRSTETFSFNEKTLPLIRDVVLKHIHPWCADPDCSHLFIQVYVISQ
ncbi:hypothetical protein P3T76_007270 [Phytophthora citrophthora]|uniref:Uncharacterized protein n=1 Tax=Phytophthora citrophthora TaxID=4793 RepID=A0AAD9GN09_9STRA|nr:hypothetical protein P3T76_007270 [Phytophthora citrophthora]